MGNFSKGLNPGNVGALLQGGVQGMQTEQGMQDKYTANQRQQQYLQEQQRENQGGNQLYNATNDFQNRTNGTNNPGFTAQTGNVFDPVRERIHGLLQSAHAKYQSVFGGGHAQGPAAQQTTQAPGNAAMSAPQPTSSSGTAGPPGATGPMPLPQHDQVSGRDFPQYAEGGAIPGRKLAGIRPKKAKAGNLAKPTAGDKQVASAQPGQQMPPQNTEASPDNQDPNISAADGKWIQGAVKHPGALHKDLGVPEGEKIPKGKIKSAEKSDNPKLAKRAQLAETLGKFKDGGMPSLPKLQPGAAPEPKPAPRSLEQDVSNDGMRKYLGRTIKRYADGDQVKPDDAQAKPVPTPAGLKTLPPHQDPDLASDLYKWNVTQPEYAGMTPPTGPSPGKGASPPQTSMATAGSHPPAPQIPVVSQSEAKLRQDSGGYDANGRPSGDVMVDTETPAPGQGGPPGAVAAAQPKPQGPPAPDKIDFSQVQVDHSQIPSTTTEDWHKLEAATALNYAAHGVGDASRRANADITGMQHDNFMDYMRQGIALDAAGNKQGAMAAYKTAYQYFPTGHDMHFGMAPDGNIIGYGVNEKTGEPVQNGVIKLDQQGVHGIITHFANPENFVNEGLRMQQMANETEELHKGKLPLERARAGYLEGANATRLASAEVRADATRGRGAMAPDIQKYYASNLKDLPDAGDAENVAAQLEAQAPGGVDQAHRLQILGIVRHLFDPGTDPAAREEFMRKYNLRPPGQQNPATAGNAGIPGRYDDPYALGNAMYGQ